MQTSAINRILKKWPLLVLVLLAIVGGFVYRSTQFRIVSTNPKVDDVSFLTPFVQVKFSHTIKQGSLTYKASSDLVTKVGTNGKTATFTLNKTLGRVKNYSITITSIEDTSGKKITNKTFAFTTKNIAFDDLPDDQQNSILSRPVAKQPYTVDTISFVDFDYLSDQTGIAADQLDTLEYSFFNFSNQVVHKEFSQINLHTDSLVVVPHDPASDNFTDGATFDVDVDGTAYKVQIHYSLIDPVSIQFYNASGNQVYQYSAPS